jgi:hypothetical protein
MNKRLIVGVTLALLLIWGGYSYGNLIAENRELRDRLTVAEARVDKMLPEWVNEGVEVE